MAALRIEEVRREAASCQRCPLYARATQTVFGEGAPRAELMLVGEQPGDKEDLAGHPFVGPAGRLLDQALEAAGLDRDRAWVTNAVKHFKWRSAGKVRLHQKPSRGEVVACRPWLEAEIDLVDPRVVVLLGATAAQSLLGTGFRVTRRRGEVQALAGGRAAVATIHPSAVLRAEDRDEELAALVRDLAGVAALLAA